MPTPFVSPAPPPPLSPQAFNSPRNEKALRRAKKPRVGVRGFQSSLSDKAENMFAVTASETFPLAPSFHTRSRRASARMVAPRIAPMRLSAPGPSSRTALACPNNEQVLLVDPAQRAVEQWEAVQCWQVKLGLDLLEER